MTWKGVRQREKEKQRERDLNRNQEIWMTGADGERGKRGEGE